MLYQLSQTKVEDFQVAIRRNTQVGRLQVAVEYVLIVRCREAFHHLDCKAQ